VTVQRSINLRCDGEDCGRHYDDPQWTVAEVREMAREEGWSRTRDGRDLCPYCNGKADRWPSWGQSWSAWHQNTLDEGGTR